MTVTVVVADAQPPLPRPPLSWATGQYRSFHAPCGVVPGGLDVLERDGAVSPELSPPAAAMQRYVLGASLGSGAFGTVRTAHLASDGRKVRCFRLPSPLERWRLKCVRFARGVL